jgi:hypothetical protein
MKATHDVEWAECQLDDVFSNTHGIGVLLSDNSASEQS